MTVYKLKQSDAIYTTNVRLSDEVKSTGNAVALELSQGDASAGGHCAIGSYYINPL